MAFLLNKEVLCGVSSVWRSGKFRVCTEGLLCGHVVQTARFQMQEVVCNAVGVVTVLFVLASAWSV